MKGNLEELRLTLTIVLILPTMGTIFLQVFGADHLRSMLSVYGLVPLWIGVYLIYKRVSLSAKAEFDLSVLLDVNYFLLILCFLDLSLLGSKLVEGIINSSTILFIGFQVTFIIGLGGSFLIPPLCIILLLIWSKRNL